MLSKLKSGFFIVFIALFTQSFFVPKNIVENNVPVNTPMNNDPHSEIKSSYKINPRLLHRFASKIMKSKLNQKKGASHRKKFPFLIKLGLIFLGLGIVFLLVAFWGWYFAVLDGLPAASWVNLLLEGGLGSVGAALACLIVGWLSN